MKFSARLYCMASSEIMGMIPKDALADIKMRDSKPLFKAFVIGHEGEARGNLIGVGNVVKKWFGAAVEKLHAKIQAGLLLFHGHAATNDTFGRIPVGEVVGKRLLNIRNRLSSVVACWIYPHYRHLPLDVASIEADIDLKEDKRKGLYVDDVKKITGIALGNSEIETPGFPGATLLGQLQAFAKNNRFTGGNETMTLEEIKQAIQEGKFRPSDLYDSEALLTDPIISERVKEKVSNARGYDIRKFEDLTKERTTLEKRVEEKDAEIKKRDGEITALKVETAKGRVGAIFTKQKEERKLDERQVKFIEPRLEKFVPEKPEDLEKEFNKYLDALVDDYKKNAEIFGVAIEDKTKDEKSKGKSGGTGAEPDDKTKTGGPEDKYLNPETNPFIKIESEA